MITHPNVKINLGLNVLRKRGDGFHDLETLFVPYFGISDTLEIVAGDDYSRTSAGLFAKYGNASVQEESQPMLVQGISEDGKLMITIARAEGVDWDPLKDLTAKAYMMLAGYASRLGSDCAFFIYNRPMIGEGRGEILSEYPLEGLDFGQQDNPSAGMDVQHESGYEIKVLTPEGIAVSTADAYRGIRPQLPEIPLRDALARPVGEWKDCLFNDFETTVFDKHPELAAIKHSLYESGAVYASMSGSGSALFAVYLKKGLRV